MEWLKAIFKNKGIEVQDDVFKDIEKEFPKHFIIKDEYNARLEEIKGLNTQISERDSQLEKLKTSAGENENLKNQITTLQNDNKTAKANFEKQLGELRFNSALDKALLKAKAVDSDLVKVKLDTSAIKLGENGELEGFDTQLKEVQKNYAFLFESGEVKVNGVKAADGSEGTGTQSDMFLQGFEG